MMNLDFLAFGAHPDDIELGCAGTLIKLARRGYRTGAITLTAGESGTRGTAEIRAREFEAAARQMLLAHHRTLDLPDAAIAETQLNKLKLVAAMRELRPALVATVHWQARHPDHIHASSLVRDAAILSGLKNLDLSPLLQNSSAVQAGAIAALPAWYPRRVLFYPERYETQISFVVDITEAFEQKMAAVRSHESQFHGANMAQYGEAQTMLTRPEFLEFIEHQNRRWGDMIGVKYGEAFYIREIVRLDDPVAAFGEWCEKAFP
jgi:bacillithiol biosynthesis deacetylase BshB1